jgi:hypothetical protein
MEPSLPEGERTLQGILPTLGTPNYPLQYKFYCYGFAQEAIIFLAGSWPENGKQETSGRRL